eukprot:7877132-Karenia_brevis.AAC.1
MQSALGNNYVRRMLKLLDHSVLVNVTELIHPKTLPLLLMASSSSSAVSPKVGSDTSVVTFAGHSWMVASSGTVDAN